MNRDRNTLKGFFIKGAIPSQENFADLIDSTINQNDDGITKLPNDPLRINASDPGETVLNFYQSVTDPKPAWALSLNSGDASPKAGLNVSDGQGNSRLFIDRSSGNVGIGTNAPGSKLHVGVNATVGPFATDSGIGRLAVTGQDCHLEFARRNLASWPADPAPGDRFVWYNQNGSAHLWTDKSGDLLTVGPNGNVGIGTKYPERKLQIGSDVIGLSFDSGTSPNAGVLRFGDGTGWQLHFGRSREKPFVKINSGTEGVLMTIHDNGDVWVLGKVTSGGGKSFRIDHPLDPANKYLNHFCVEGSEAKNLYDGRATLNEKGEAVVELPAWFEALNKNFQYQLTPLGKYAPLYIADEVRNNRFTIAGGDPGMEVCWEVTGVRNDAYAQAHPTTVEEEKSDAKRR